jgi:AcrR family transcriptional regulator
MSETEPTVEKQSATRTRLVESALALFSRNGYAATGVKAILADAKTPYGSLYHWFPGGKRELGVAAVQHGGARYREIFETHYPAHLNIVDATEGAFVEAADMLEATDYVLSCPLATIALEVASTDEAMRLAASEAFESWLVVFENRFLAIGMSTGRSREMAINIFCLIEGAAMLARTKKSPEPMRLAGRTAANIITAALEAEGIEIDR